MRIFGRYHVDPDGRNSKGLWPVRDPQGLTICFTATRDDGTDIVDAFHELRRLRIILAWQCGQLAESQACAGLSCKPEDLVRMRDTCLARALK